MNHYRVLLTDITKCWLEIEAHDEGQARQIALDRASWPEAHEVSDTNPHAKVKAIVRYYPEAE